MGISPFNKRCNYAPEMATTAVAPNPDPNEWEFVRYEQFENAYVLQAKYKGCTNYDGNKVMVYRGMAPLLVRLTATRLDPHFERSAESPIARFRPDSEGWKWACKFASEL